jgi:hypothetical protein
VLLRAEDARERWEIGELDFRGWRVTAAARDGGGRTYVAVATEVFGCAILASDDLRRWEPLGSAPRYEPSERGNPDHNRTITFNSVAFQESVTSTNPLGLCAGAPRGPDLEAPLRR